MRTSSVILIACILVTGSLFFSGISTPETVGETDNTSSRKTYDNITTFDFDVSEKLLEFGPGGGVEVLNVTFAKRTKVLGADVEIEGMAGLKKFVYNFNDTKNHSAWKGDTPTIPPGNSPSSYENVSFIGKEYTAIQNIDSTRTDHDSTNFKSISRLYHLFKFNVSGTTPSKFRVYWVGQSYVRNNLGMVKNEETTYIFCPQNSTWVKIDFQDTLHTSNIKTFKVDKEVSQAGNYIDPSTKAVYVMVIGISINPNAKDNGRISTDFVELTGMTSDLNYPSNVGLDVGGDGDKEWSTAGQLSSKVQIGDTQGLKTEIQEHIDAAGTGEGNMVVPFKISVGGAGGLWIGNLKIFVEELEPNDAPGLVPLEFEGLTMTEDDPASGNDLLDLTKCFTDDHDAPADLTYAIIDAGDTSTLKAVMDADGHHIDFTPAPDFYGKAKFRVSATDSGADEQAGTFDDLVRLSNYFNVTVEPVNDAPYIESPAQQFYVNESGILAFGVSAVDIDDDVFLWDSNNTDELVITTGDPDSSEAKVEFTPGTEDVGKTRYFRIKVWDYGGSQGENFLLSAIFNFSVEVKNLNDPPKFVDLELLEYSVTEHVSGLKKIVIEKMNTAVEDEEYGIAVTAYDPDIGIDPDEELTFAVEPSEPLNGTLTIELGTGLITFVPENGDVGIVEFKLTVTDRQGAKADLAVVLPVENVNDAPMNVKITAPTVTKFTTDDLINFTGECYDADLEIPDSEEYLTFTWFTNLSSAPIGTGSELWNRRLTEGHHQITLQVVDNKGESVSTSIDLQVISPVIIPDPNDGDGDGGGKDKDNKSDPDDKNSPPVTKQPDEKRSNSALMAALAVVVILIVIIIVVFGFLRPRRKKPVEEADQIQDGAAAAVPGVSLPGQYNQMYPQQPMIFGQPVQPVQPGFYPYPQETPGMFQPQFQPPAAVPLQTLPAPAPAAAPSPAPAPVQVQMETPQQPAQPNTATELPHDSKTNE